MQLNINIPDEQSNRLVNAFASTYGYQDKLMQSDENGVLVPVDNPQTKRQFFKEKVVEYIKTVVSNHELEEARKNITVSQLDIQ